MTDIVYDGYKAFFEYLAIKQHFTSDYDYFKYHGKLKSQSKEAFLKRKDKYYFRKIEKKHKNELSEYFVAQFIANKKWVGNMHEETFIQWKKRIQAMGYYLRQEIEHLKENIDIDESNFNDLFSLGEKHPIVFRYYMNELISPESVVSMDSVLGFLKLWKKSDDFVLSEAGQLLDKYRPWIQGDIDLEKTKNIMRDVFIAKESA